MGYYQVPQHLCLNMLKRLVMKGDVKTMDKICRLIMSKCDDNLTIQNKTAALDTYVDFHGIKAMPDILKAAAHSNSKYRNAAIRMSLAIPENEVVKKWIEYFPKAIPAARSEIISMLGKRSDQLALASYNCFIIDHD